MKNTHNKERLLQLMAILNVLQSEINNLKNSLAFTLQQDLSHTMLQRIEAIQTHLLNEDVAIALIRHEMTTYLNTGNDDAEESEETYRFIQWEQKMMHDIDRMRAEIALLNTELEKVQFGYKIHESDTAN